MLMRTRNPSRVVRLLAAAAAGALLAGCDQDQADEALGEDVELSAPVAQVVRAWREAELGVADVHALVGEAASKGADLGGTCMAATVAEIPVVLCEHDSPEAAKAAEETGLDLVGAATGLSLSRGSLLLVAADRHEADPDGRRLNEIANAFRKLE
jgi:hypothetical protein